MDSGVATIDYAFLNDNQKGHKYKGLAENWIQRLQGGGEKHPFTRNGILAHEVLGHGLDYAKGDKRDNQNDAIGRANIVRLILGLPLRFGGSECND
jgi:hypothetical protein